MTENTQTDHGNLLPADIDALARRVIEENAAAGRKIALAESCGKRAFRQTAIESRCFR